MSKINVLSMESFYDSIAQEYNRHLTDDDTKARMQISQLFIDLVPKGDILDFGGGTGLDLPWLIKNNYSVFFLEPSVNMRKIAERSIPETRSVKFLSENIDPRNWSSLALPFTEKMQGILANFAVLNCIEDIGSLFEKISLVCRKGCYLIITVINTRLKSVLRNYSFFTALSIGLTGNFKLYQRYKQAYYETHLHSFKAIKRAARNHFDFIKIHPIRYSNFSVIIFSKK